MISLNLSPPLRTFEMVCVKEGHQPEETSSLFKNKIQPKGPLLKGIVHPNVKGYRIATHHGFNSNYVRPGNPKAF